MTIFKKGWATSAVLGILLVALFLRCKDVGVRPLGADDSIISLKAIDLARHGEFTLLGTVMSVGLWHSPFSIYVYAIPYAISTDPRIARLFTGLLNVIGVALAYFIGAKFFNRPAGLIASLLIAVHGEMVYWGSGIWNPNIGAPFALLFVATSLRGYYLNHRTSRLINLLALSLSVQCHPAVALLLPLNLPLYMYAWFNRPAQRWQLIWQTVSGGVIALASLVPWGLGLYSAVQVGGAQTEPGLVTGRGAGYIIQTIYEGLGNWRVSFFQPVIPALVILGGIWLVVQAIRRRDRLPGLILTLSFFLVPILSWAFNAKFRNHFLASSYPNALLILGVFLSSLLSVRFVRWLVPPLLTLTVGLHLIYSFEPPQNYLGPIYSLDEQIAAINTAGQLASQSGRDLLILADDTGNEPPYGWELLNEGRAARVIWHNRPLPVSANGAVLVGFANDNSRPDLFADGQLIGQYFRLTELSTDHLNLDWPALQPIQFANGTRVIGFFAPPAHTLPTANQTWRVYLLAQVGNPNMSDQTFFAHLVNAAGDKYAQADVPALPAGQQRSGEWMMAQFDFEFGDGLPDTGPLYLRMGLYGSEGQSQVVDANNTPLGDFALIQIRGQSQPLFDNDVLALDEASTTSPLSQGPPLTITATWHVIKPVTSDLQIHWRLINKANQTVYESKESLIEIFTIDALPVGAFFTQQYELRLPTDLAPETYTLEATLLDANDRPVWGAPFPQPVEIQPRARQFTLPTIQHAVNAIYNDQITFLGYDLNLAAKVLQLNLYWQPTTTIDRDFKYFVHVWQNGQVVAQIDSAPAQYQYLTSWWTPGEIIVEPISLDLTALPSGNYDLTTGFYDPVTGERLAVTLADGTHPADQWVTLQTIALP